jgi:hypothetical protein
MFAPQKSIACAGRVFSSVENSSFRMTSPYGLFVGNQLKLGRMALLGQDRYFNYAQPHQDIGQRIPCQPVREAEPLMMVKLVSRSVLGGLHHDYHRRSQERPSYPRAA